MRNLFYFLSILLAFNIIAACDKNNDTLSEEALAESIAFSENKLIIPKTELSAEIKLYVQEHHFETYIESAFFASDLGYEIVLGDEELIYFDHRNNRLNPDRLPFGKGPCGRSQAVLSEDLPTEITDYIASNYPDNNILRAKKKLNNGPYFVAIDQPLILIFDADGTFSEATVFFFHCRAVGDPIDITDLPETILTFVNEHYDNPEILVAFHKTNGNYILGILADGTRKIVGFDTEGNMLFERP